MITISRIDERLIHGQVAYSWTTAYKSEAVMAIDEGAAADSFQRDLLKMACPPSMKCFVVNPCRAIELLKKYAKRRIFVVAKHPKTFLELVEGGIDIPEINVGGLYFQEGRRQISKTVYVDDEMVSVFKALSEKGIVLENRTTPTDAKNDLMKLL